MDKKEILKHIDHTLLKAVATWEDIKVLCDEAIILHVIFHVFMKHMVTKLIFVQ